MKFVVGISEMAVSDRPEDLIITYSLGSCIGLTLYEPKLRIGGLIHCMLPLSKIDPARAVDRPCMFTDTGVPLLLATLLNMGAEKRNLIAKVAGAASLLDNNGSFNIGERNQVILRKLLWKNQILIQAEETGGTKARTMSLNMETGVTLLRSGGVEYEL
ncbi:MAG: chemotaxis protein CheD [Candidatus Hydrogenedentes bacterium]|nr:chemotaxis protein CheD [Candidatus Hydrogenedentota bacterium]